jgi:hypothetical protein
VLISFIVVEVIVVEVVPHLKLEGAYAWRLLAVGAVEWLKLGPLIFVFIIVTWILKNHKEGTASFLYHNTTS